MRLTSQGPSTDARMTPDGRSIKDMSDPELEAYLARLRGLRSMVPRTGDRAAGVRRPRPAPEPEVTSEDEAGEACDER